ncbi:hypothetical protein FGO68_gene16677 [Halteria grandinella]|uniref:Uncharacterized protein n=1 Tax=Halteria grandinella TaxID=5974 RepID=A0A8J8SVK0_HALGN|nr:hypothetical protein FGO68_gene16677 [Halteria grandinella]
MLKRIRRIKMNKEGLRTDSIGTENLCQEKGTTPRQQQSPIKILVHKCKANKVDRKMNNQRGKVKKRIERFSQPFPRERAKLSDFKLAEIKSTSKLFSNPIITRELANMSQIMNHKVEGYNMPSNARYQNHTQDILNHALNPYFSHAPEPVRTQNYKRLPAPNDILKPISPQQIYKRPNIRDVRGLSLRPSIFEPQTSFISGFSIRQPRGGAFSNFNGENTRSKQTPLHNIDAEERQNYHTAKFSTLGVPEDLGMDLIQEVILERMGNQSNQEQESSFETDSLSRDSSTMNQAY